MTDTIGVRDGRPADLAAIAAMQVASWPIEFAGIAPAERVVGIDLETRTAALSRMLAPFFDYHEDVGTGLLVAVADGEEVVGKISFGAALDDDCDPVITGDVGSILVHPSRRRYGIGTALMATAEHRMRRARRSDAVLWVLEPNSRARAFYDACGWRHDGERRTPKAPRRTATTFRRRRHRTEIPQASPAHPRRRTHRDPHRDARPSAP